MKIPAEILGPYLRYEISSEEVGRLTGYHPVSIRRAVKRVRPPSQLAQAKALRDNREKFRASLANLPVKEIKAKAFVSTSTAARIKKKHGTRRLHTAQSA